MYLFSVTQLITVASDLRQRTKSLRHIRYLRNGMEHGSPFASAMGKRLMREDCLCRSHGVKLRCGRLDLPTHPFAEPEASIPALPLWVRSGHYGRTLKTTASPTTAHPRAEPVKRRLLGGSGRLEKLKRRPARVFAAVFVRNLSERCRRCSKSGHWRPACGVIAPAGLRSWSVARNRADRFPMPPRKNKISL